MQWLALGLVLVLGAATLVTQDSRFIMAKPTVIHWAIGAVMLRRGWMTRYLPPIARDNIPASVLVIAGYAWAALMIVLGALNLLVALTMSIQAWAWFITVGAVGAKVVAFLAQYWVFRLIIVRKLRSSLGSARRCKRHDRRRRDHRRRRRRGRAGGGARAGRGRPRGDGAGAARADRLGDLARATAR